MSNITVALKDKAYIYQIGFDIFKIGNEVANQNNYSDYDVLLYDNNSKTNKNITIKNAILAIKNQSVAEDNNNISSPQVYITFGTLIAILQSKFALYNFRNGLNIPTFSFDMNFDNLEEDENYICKFPGEISADPLTCLIPYEAVEITSLSQISGVKIVLPDTTLNQTLARGSAWNADLYLGRLPSIYVNLGFIFRTLDSLSNNEDKSVVLLDFLNTVLKSITESLGGFNKITVQSTDEGLIRFIEEIPQKFVNLTPFTRDYAQFKTFGVIPGSKGSFIRSIDLSSELSNNFASMVSIGAQANSNQVSSNATSFSNYNAGLEDRIIPNKFSYPATTGKTSGGILEDLWDKLKEGNGAVLFSLYNNLNFSSENITLAKSLNATYANLMLGELSKQSDNQQIQGPFFMPFNMSLEIDGLSGMVLYQKFIMSNDILPPSYENDDVDLIIKGINHTITPEAWITKLDTLSVPSDRASNIIRPTQAVDAGEEPVSTNAPRTIIDTPSPATPSSSKRIEAMRKSYEAVFRDHGQKPGYCSRWSYNLALNYVRALRNNNNIAGAQVAAGGNAGDDINYFKNLVKLGYTQYKAGSNISRADCINLIKNTTWGYGDIVAYKAKDGDGSQRKYGHTQIYVGDINSSKWSTSTKNNYGTAFVYSRTNSNVWDFYIFRAPES
jgi:hypothetical protein